MVALSLSPLFSAAQVRAADAWTSDVVSVPSLVMMEHAGRAVADVVVTRLPAFTCGSDGSVLVVCGRGSNGGDGLVCARHLGGRGVSVRVLLPREPEGGDAAITLRLLRTAIEKKQLPVTFVDVEQALSVPAGVVVDAIFGTGLVRPLDDDALALVSLIARARAGGAVVVAVDVPSGLPTDGARPSHAVVVADVTVSFGGLKIAHVAEPGVESCGEVVDVDIGLLHPPDEVCSVFALQSVTLPSPSSLSHKGSYGHVGVVEGAAGMRGASQLSALAALRAGAGRVTLLGEGAERIPELMATDLHSADLHSAAGVDVVVIGPGWVGLLPPALLLWRARGVKVVADAGALDVLVAGQADVWTPHAGEAGRVLGCSASEVQGDRMAAARALVERLGGVVVLKGAQPVVSSSSRTVIVRGRVPALAVAGSGDVLAGVIGALLAGAQGVCSIDDAVVAAVWLHQEAGRGLNRGALASEIADAVAQVIARA